MLVKNQTTKSTLPNKFRLPLFRKMYTFNAIIFYRYWFPSKFIWKNTLYKEYERYYYIRKKRPFKPLKNLCYVSELFTNLYLKKIRRKKEFVEKLSINISRLQPWKFKNKLRWASLFSKGSKLTTLNIFRPWVYFTRRPSLFIYSKTRKLHIFKKNKRNKIFTVVPKVFKSGTAKQKYYYILNNLKKISLVNSDTTKLKVYRYLRKFLLKKIRRFNKTRLSIVINYSKNNYFISVVSALTGNFMRLFSSGALKHKTTRRRRDFNSLLECWEKMIVYLKAQRVNKLGFVKILHKKYLSRIELKRASQFKQLARSLKKNRIFVKRWVNVTVRAHGLLPRAPKLRRK